MARNKEFEVHTVLGKAMDVFWEKGYEKTSMQDLVTQMGVHRRSIYDTFGDKHELFMQVIDRYDELVVTPIHHSADGLPSAKQAIRHIFERTIRKKEQSPRGCLMVNTAVELAVHDEEAAAKVNQSFGKTEAKFQELVELGLKSGEIGGGRDAQKLSQFLNNALLGLRVLVKTTDNREKLQGIVDITMSVLD
ncbi:TetR/AcrR family transcriptional regulator [Paenibacillus aceris]|uniref:TetR/AcrR family transcriptional repressor of nem operon n=1 Tax=Paenibacillus aceris TaxID=869555 RepID=A0ABS4I578_9BACL|nr:TetR/AcrR family transcriptional regulator [Paenibacillus aceris]MBP1965985.1 TetR/AcrR family transcriptional repressor of nem operon [Paenibacillus aceris]NHW35018.1 TetR/AcrR family transcriptional regulator [Paenibacillus aceris]